MEFARNAASNFSFETWAEVWALQLKMRGNAKAIDACFKKSRRVLTLRSISFVLRAKLGDTLVVRYLCIP